MKSAIYITDNVTQFVLTAETDIDRKILEQLENGTAVDKYRGSFYECRGGWTRFREPYYGMNFHDRTHDDSLIFRIEKPATGQAEQAPTTNVKEL